MVDNTDDFEDILDDATEEIKNNRNGSSHTTTSAAASSTAAVASSTYYQSQHGRAYGSYHAAAAAGPPRLVMDFANKDAFLFNAPPSPGMIQCRILRENDDVLQKLYPKYSLWLEESRQFLLASQKSMTNTSSNYRIFSDHANLSKGSPAYCGNLRSSFMGTDFAIFGKGSKPSKATSLADRRQSLGFIVYEPNILGTQGPRKFRVFLPSLERGSNTCCRIYLDKDDEVTLESVKKEDMAKLFCLKNREPQWSSELKAYALNFYGRVTQPSVKNFQLVDDRQPQATLLQFGRIGKNEFVLDFQSPISGLQAFAIVLSSFDGKLACD